MINENNVVDILNPREISNLGFELNIIDVEHSKNINSILKQNLIEKGWNELTKTWEIIKQPYYNADLFYFEGILKTKSNLTIQVTKSTSYKNTVGLRYWRENPTYSLDLSKIQSLATKTNSAIAIIKNPKGEVLWRIREGGDWSKSLEMPGGFIRVNELDLRQSLANRLQEDLKLDLIKSDLKIIRFLHLKDIYECMIVFELIIDESTQQKILKDDKTKKLVFISKDEFRHINIQANKIHPQMKLPFHYPSQRVFEHIFKE